MANIAAMTNAFPEGSVVQTHSLISAEYNALTGRVTGPAVEKSGVIRIPVTLSLSPDDASSTKKNKDMLLQPKNLTLLPPSPANDIAGATEQDMGGEMRECRCMFCGEGLLLDSEEAAVAHMEVCPSLQEQLNDTEHQFTLPQSMK